MKNKGSEESTNSRALNHNRTANAVSMSPGAFSNPVMTFSEPQGTGLNLGTRNSNDDSLNDEAKGEAGLAFSVDGAEYKSVGSSGSNASGSASNNGIQFDFDTSELFGRKNKSKLVGSNVNKDADRLPGSSSKEIDPEDYFLLSSSDDDLFKMVETRYRSKWQSLTAKK